MIGDLKTYIRNIVGIFLTIILTWISLEYGLFRILMSSVYNAPYWQQAYYSFYDMYQVLLRIHDIANNINNSHEVIGYALKVQMIFTFALFFTIFIISLIAYSSLSFILAIDPKVNQIRFANKRELKKAGLFKPGGVVIGGYKTWTGKILPLYHHGEEHIYLESTTGTGKSVASAIPTALSWRGSIILNDNKGELYRKSAPFRKLELNSKIIKLNLSCFMPDSAFFNPLLEIRKCSFSEAKDVSKIAKIISNVTDAEFNSNDNPNIYFVRGPVYIIEACILHCLYTLENPTLKDVAALVADLEVDELINLMEATDHIAEVQKQKLTKEQINFINTEFRNEAMHPTIKRQFKGLTLVKESPKQLAGLIDSARTNLQLFSDPLIQKITSQSSFRISELVDDYQACSLYLIYEPSDSGRLAVLIRMVFELAADYMMVSEAKPTFRNRLLLEIDEFPQLGKLDKVKQILEIGRSAGIKVCVIVQEQSQLISTYGKNQIITSQSSVKITYTPNTSSVEYVQKYMVGETEEHKKSVTRSSNNKSTDSASVNTSKEKRYLLSMEELLNLPIIKKKTIKISFKDSLKEIRKNNYKLTDQIRKDLLYILDILTRNFPEERQLKEVYDYFYRELDTDYMVESDYDTLINNERFMEYISRPIEKEIAVKPGDVIFNVSTLRPFRQYRGTQFCYMFDKEYLRRSEMKMPKEEAEYQPQLSVKF